MKTYACYPRTKFQPHAARFVNPFFTPVNHRHQSEDVTKGAAANILRKESAYVIELAVPGLGKEDIKIEINDGLLTISAQQVRNEDSPKFIRHEFDFNGFKRTFRLHKNANTEAMTASFDQGILTLVVPDREPETRKIEIL